MVLAASILLLPVFDDWLPGSLVLALVCLAWRLIRLFPRTYNQYQQRLTARSIQTAVDCLDEGILISWEKGEPVLVNFTMYAVMEQLVGTVVRNANIFWHLRPFCGNRPGLSMERQGRDLLFRWDSGQGWPGPIQTGTGLQAMEQRVWALGGRLTLTKTPHFIITVEMGENHDPTDHRRRPKNPA